MPARSGSLQVEQPPALKRASLASRLKAVSELPIVLDRRHASPPVLKGTVPAKIEIEIFTDQGAAAAGWKDFERQADHTPFQSFGWLEKWQRHIGQREGAVPVIVFGRAEDGDMLFILPLAIEKGSALRRLTWLGVQLGDYNAPLLAARFADCPAAKSFPAVWAAIVALLRTDTRLRFDLVDLPKMPDTVGAQSNPLLGLPNMPNRNGAYIATLGDDWDSYYAATRSASTRKTARRKLKQLEAHGTIRFVGQLDLHSAEQTVATLIQQKSEVFARMGIENIFLRPGYPEFYTALVADPELSGLVHVARLDVGEAVGATSVALQLRGRYYVILSSYHGGEISRFGPGTAHLHELMRYAIEHGFRQFDFTIGDESYKLDWADIKLTLYDHLQAFTLRGWIASTWSAMLRRVLRFIKQTPILWKLAVRVRAFLGGRRPAGPASSGDGE
jgi:CelD/BcsL family acetyltransferase involved in cellulose biosynthesis